MKYFKHIIVVDSEKRFQSYQPEGMLSFFPDDPANTDYGRMMEEVDAGTSTIEEVDDTPE
jgi:hypothetical protein